MNAPKKEEASKNKYKLWSVCFSFHLRVYLYYKYLYYNYFFKNLINPKT